MIGELHSLVLLAVGAATAILAGQAMVAAMHRYTQLSLANLYLPLGICGLATAGSVAVGSQAATTVCVIALVSLTAMVVTGRRRRLQALGGGGELREYELARRLIWQPAPRRAAGERVRLGGQGEIVRVKPWSEQLPYVSVLSREDAEGRDRGPRLPLGEGQHVFMVGATGAGKTTTARRLIAARVLGEGSSLLILDQKGDREDVEQMRRLAAQARVAFVLFDSQDESTDRWQPLWGTPGQVAARVTEAIKESEPYYYEVMRNHLDVVCRVLHAAGQWPPSIPLLLDACEPKRFEILQAIANGLSDEHGEVRERVELHSEVLASAEGRKEIQGGCVRLRAPLALATRMLVTPRVAQDGQAVAVSVREALRAGAVVMFRTHADTMPKEAAALTAVALADLHAAAEDGIGEWTVLLDEFGAVISTAADRALAILQRGRSHHGQAIVITQSVADIEALTGATGMLDSLTDNFAAIVAHRQTSPDSRDWLARLMGTRELSQQTAQTDGHGSRQSGRGSSRRVHEFRVAPDIFAHLDRGEAVIYSPEGRQADRSYVSALNLPPGNPEQVDHNGPRHPVEVLVCHAQRLDADAAKHDDMPAGLARPDAEHSGPWDDMN
jgi:ABC-type oligopeptide transport system ATPase subunit